jgi:hypothetical protein
MLGCAPVRRLNPLPLPRLAAAAIFAATVILSQFAAPPGNAFDLFATHEVTAQFATPDGKPIANAEVRVFAPGEPTTPFETGHTDAAGKFVFDADRDGLWSAEARTRDEVARIMVRVGGASSPHRRVDPLIVIGVLGLVLVAAFWFRLRRIRPRAPKR